MKDANGHRRCGCCGARVESGRGFFHRVGVAVADLTRDLPIRIVTVLTCNAAYCVSKRNLLAAQG